MQFLRALWVAATGGALLIAGCGGGGGDGNGAATQPPAVARIEVTPAAVLMTPDQPAQTLRAKAFDADGREIDVPIAWTSSRPAEVAVGADGRVSAAAPIGSAQVFAEVGGVRSAPVLATVAEVAPGVQLLDDAQVVSLPVAVDPNASALDVEVETVLSGFATPPAPGTLLLGRQGLAIGGEVVSATAEGANVRVRLRLGLGDIKRLVPRARLNETIDLRGLPLTPAPEVTEFYDFAKVGDEYVFTPKPGVGGFTPRRLSAPRTQALATKPGRSGPLAIDPVPPLVKHRLGPFECEIAEPVLPVNLTNPGGFTIKFEPVYTLQYDENDGLRKLELGAAASFKWKGALQFNAGALFNLTCEATLFRKLAPMPGWVGLILSGEIKGGLGFEAEGSITMPLLGAEAQLELSAQLAAGIECVAGDCHTIGRFTPEAKSGWRFITPDDALGNLRSEFFIFPYGFAGLKAGATLVEKARIDVFTVRGGLKAEANLAPENTQMTAPVLPGFPDYRSAYKIGLLAEIAAGSFNKGETDLRALLQRLGLFKATLLKWQLAVPLASSPTGTVTMDRAAVRNGDVVNFRVKLDAANASLNLFPVGLDATRIYNVKRIRIVRAGPFETTRTVAVVEAAPDQLVFDLTWLAEGVIDESQGQFSAFVDTAGVPLPVGLELGPAVLSTQKVLVQTQLAEIGTATSMAVPVEVSRGTVAMSPDGRFVLYSKDVLPTPTILAADLFMFSVDDGSIRQMTQTNATESHASWSPAGDAFVYSSTDENRIGPAPRLRDIRRRNVVTGNDISLFTFSSTLGDVEAVSWSPDGASVAVIVKLPFDVFGPNPTPFGKLLYIVNPDGTNLREQLRYKESASASRAHVDWSPDGQQIVLVETVELSDRSEQPRIRLVDLPNGTSRALTQPPVVSSGVFFRDANPVFSPDGSRIAFLRLGPGSPARDDGLGVHVVAADGSGARRIFDGRLGDNRVLGWNNDGDAVVANGRLDAAAPARVLLLPLAGPAREAIPAVTPANQGQLGDLLQRPARGNTNLAVQIVGGARQEPGAAFTVSINATNRSAIEATDVRVELEVPPGWQVTQLTGASGCERSLTSVVCRLDAMTRDTPRAVLADVVAPQLIGEHKLIARVSSLQRDSELVNNTAELAVDIGTPRR